LSHLKISLLVKKTKGAVERLYPMESISTY
jgi:hypothetical protein